MNEATKKDAHEYGQHVKAGGWRLGLLVARNVERGAGAGGRIADKGNKVVGGEEVVAKVGIKAFAKEAKVGIHLVSHHLQAWEKAVEAKRVPAAEKLSPGKDVRLPGADEWGDFYTPVSGGFNGSKTRLAHNPGQFAQAFAALPDEQKEMVAQEIAVRDDFAKAVKADTVVRDMLVGSVADPAKAKEAGEEAHRNLLGKHALFGWAAVAEGFGDANLGLNHSLDALVKLTINARVNPEDDALNVAHLRAEKIGRTIYEIEMAAGENLITDTIAKLRDGVLN